MIEISRLRLAEIRLKVLALVKAYSNIFEILSSGDAGDELFCGYNRYTYTDKLWKWLRLTPSILRKNLGEGLGGISAHRWNQVFKLVDKLSPQKFNGVVLGNNLRKGARVISSHELTELYKGLVSTWQDPTALVIGASESENLLLKDVGLIVQNYQNYLH